MIRRSFIVFCCLMSSACASWLSCPVPGALPAMGAVETLPSSAVQVLRIQYGEHQADLLCAFARQSANWKLACTSPTGIRLITMNVDELGQVETIKAPQVPAAVDGARIASDFVLAFWPESAIRPWVDRHGYELLTSQATRTLRLGGRSLISVNYSEEQPWAGPLAIKQHELGYDLEIETRNIQHGSER